MVENHNSLTESEKLRALCNAGFINIYNNKNSSNKTRFYDTAYIALEEGNLDDYAYIRDDLMKSLGVSGKDIDSAMKSRYSNAVKSDPAYKLPEESAYQLGIRQKYSSAKDEEDTPSFGADDLDSAAYGRYVNRRTETYKGLEKSITASDEFKGLSPEDKDRALNWAYSLSSDLALESASDGRFQVTTKWETYAKDAEAAGIGTDEYLLFHVVYETSSSDKDANGKDVKGAKKSDKVRNWLEDQQDLTDGQRAWLWSTVYSSAW